MYFYLGGVNPRKNVVELLHDNWNDWFTFTTLYVLHYYDEKGECISIGSVKIGEKGLKKGSPNLPSHFQKLPHNFFSLGQDVTYYQTLVELGDDIREEILAGLNDIAFNEEIYNNATEEEVTYESLLRSVSRSSVTGQYRRLARGNALLTEYSFRYSSPFSEEYERLVLDFDVYPNSNPPTNLHVVIGRNGVGKTFLLNNMTNSLVDEQADSTTIGEFSFINRETGQNEINSFANVVSVSFSAFDDTIPLSEKKETNDNIKYSYIGLKKNDAETQSIYQKKPDDLADEFVYSLRQCFSTSKKKRWSKAISLLETDPIFKESQISVAASNVKHPKFNEITKRIFKRLSSGHKIVLLTTTRLIETIQEKSLIIIDEPEGYLHPPLLSAFIRTISELLIDMNAVAIVATHSPVVLQEVPRRCVWKLFRDGANSSASRMEIETFGENIGLLTQEVFGLEVTEAGFHSILKNAVNSTKDYEDTIQLFNNELGNEAKGIIRNLVLLMNNTDEKDK